MAYYMAFNTNSAPIDKAGGKGTLTMLSAYDRPNDTSPDRTAEVRDRRAPSSVRVRGFEAVRGDFWRSQSQICDEGKRVRQSESFSLANGALTTSATEAQGGAAAAKKSRV
ncbi:ADP-ribosylation factor GTPase-activating protein GCS1 [Corchorus olitorius]|uniref:ADP-ribosylation factor GTPase-activating protein GCS1 n=1 Tax=Corchorus olitorius TaxID=93759 RepID=A0A1R3H215_9ROSI|nr:ADP-ribosylation factor GTPase-activating protein GCS1 [Corchorus olitorius]